jgi:Fibrobacter succinogenes major domain (Fib_succ_major).
VNKISFILLIIPLVLLVSCTTEPDDDDSWDAAKVCPETGTNSYGMPNRGTFTDERDGQVYKYTTIGKQVWMAENLRFVLQQPYSLCYGKQHCFVNYRYKGDEGESICKTDTSNLADIAKKMNFVCADNDCIADKYCEKFGRYYTLMENAGSLGLIDRDVADSVCPHGWHVPARAEWEKLIDNVDGKTSRLLSQEPVYFRSSNDVRGMDDGTDDCGMNIYPSASLNNGGKPEGPFFKYVFYWTQTQATTAHVDVLHFTYYQVKYIQGTDFFPIRCIKD